MCDVMLRNFCDKILDSYRKGEIEIDWKNGKSELL